MPVDGHKTYRFMVLDECLSNRHHRYTIDDLVDACNRALERKGYRTVSDRTIKQDLSDIELAPYNARLNKTREGHKIIYRYRSDFPGINFFEISDEERDRIDDAIKVLKRFDGNPQYDWVRFCLQQIVSDEFMEDNRSIISFQNNPDLYGIEHFQTLLKAISEKQPLKVVYKPYPQEKDGKLIVREEETYNLHPYHLKEFNDRWYLIAQAEGMPFIGNYPLDRIVSIAPLHKKFIETDFDFEEYFDNAIGVTVREEIQEVLLKVNKIRYPYIKSKPLHWSQTELKELETPTHVVIRLKVCLNNELEAAILSYSNDVEVLKPKLLRDRISQRVQEMNKIYKQ